MSLLTRLATLGLSTPLIYGGGIRNVEDAIKVVGLGADRVCVDSLLWDKPQSMESIARILGIQALIVNMPIRVHENSLRWLNYRSHKEVPLKDKVLVDLYLEWSSEVMLTDWQHEGFAGSFDPRIPLLFPNLKKPLIVFGGLSQPAQLREMLSLPNVLAVGVGNFLSHKEHAIQLLKGHIFGVPIRPAQYAQEDY